MPKSDLTKKKLLKLYNIESLSHKEIDKIAKNDVDLRLALHAARKDFENKQASKQVNKKEPEKPAPKISVKIKPKKKESGSTQGVQIREQYKDKFGKKMTKQEVQDKYFKRTLDPLREQLNVLVQEANQRYIDQLESGNISRAGIEAERTLNKRGREYYMQTALPFNSDLHSTKEINREFGRVMNFLNDYTSTLEGGIIESKQAAGLFGGQWRKQGMNGYDENNVSKADADMVFDIYHRLLESQGGWQRLIGYFKAVNPGVVDYGSENLINSIYDMVQNRDTLYVPESMDVEGVILARANELVNSMIDSYMKLSVLQRSGKDYGSMEDPDDADRRRQIYEWGLRRDKYKEEYETWRNR